MSIVFMVDGVHNLSRKKIFMLETIIIKSNNCMFLNATSAGVENKHIINIIKCEYNDII